MLFSYVQHLQAFSNGPTAKVEQVSSTWCVMWYIRVHGITSQNPVTSVLAAATTSKLNAQGIPYISPSAPISAHSTKCMYQTATSV